jgi:hypothetical protein
MAVGSLAIGASEENSRRALHRLSDSGSASLVVGYVLDKYFHPTIPMLGDRHGVRDRRSPVGEFDNLSHHQEPR